MNNEFIGRENVSVSRMNSEIIGTAHFSQHFTLHYGVMQATHPMLCREIYRFRHKMYCEELKFEDVRADKLERDSADKTAIHFAVTHNATGKVVACARLLVDTKPENLPITQFCHQESDALGLHPLMVKQNTVCELSRFIVDSQFSSAKSAVEAGFSEESVVVGQLRYVTVLMAMDFAQSAGWVNMYVLSEPRFIRVMRIAGMPIRAIDNYVNFKGLRRPAHVDIPAFFANETPAFTHAEHILRQHQLEESQAALLVG